MTVARVSNVSGLNLNTENNTVTVPFIAANNALVVVHVGLRTADQSVISVVDNITGNVYVQRASSRATEEFDYPSNEYAKSPLFTARVSAECWVVKSTGSVTSITVTLSSGAKCAVVVQSYTGSNFGSATSTSITRTSAPSISLTTTAGNSYVSAGFTSAFAFTQAATSGTLLSQASAGTSNSAISVAVGDSTVASAGTCTVTLAPTNTEVIYGEPSGPITTAIPADYAICAVEILA